MSLLTVVYLSSPACAQPPSEAVLQDLSQRAMIQVSTIQGYMKMIAGAEYELATRQRGIKSCLKLFASDATVQEGNRRGGRRDYSVRDYFQSLLYRGKRNPVIMDFKMLSAMNPGDLSEVVNPDGSVSYRGKVRFDQHYCRTNGTTTVVETKVTPNCTYEDSTEKEVTIDMSRMRNSKGVFWLINIQSIRVINVR
jgi:hypothetical protein